MISSIDLEARNEAAIHKIGLPREALLIDREKQNIDKNKKSENPRSRWIFGLCSGRGRRI